MNIKGQLQFNLPIVFYDVCTVYPLTVTDVICNNNDDINQLFLPYAITKAVLDEKYIDYDLYDIIFEDTMLFQTFINSLVFFCRTEDIKYNELTHDIYFDDNVNSLNKNNFEEFSQIILEMGQRERITKNDISTVPHFETEEGYQKWKKLQDMRKKYKSKDEDISIHEIVNYVQFGGKCYIPDNEIKQWSYWKLITSYKTLSNINGYDSKFNIFLQTGDKELIAKHWTDLIKL